MVIRTLFEKGFLPLFALAFHTKASRKIGTIKMEQELDKWPFYLIEVKKVKKNLKGTEKLSHFPSSRLHLISFTEDKKLVV